MKIKLKIFTICIISFYFLAFFPLNGIAKGGPARDLKTLDSDTLEGLILSLQHLNILRKPSSFFGEDVSYSEIREAIQQYLNTTYLKEELASDLIQRFACPDCICEKIDFVICLIIIKKQWQGANVQYYERYCPKCIKNWELLK